MVDQATWAQNASFIQRSHQGNRSLMQVKEFQVSSYQHSDIQYLKIYKTRQQDGKATKRQRWRKNMGCTLEEQPKKNERAISDYGQNFDFCFQFYNSMYLTFEKSILFSSKPLTVLWIIKIFDAVTKNSVTQRAVLHSFVNSCFGRTRKSISSQAVLYSSSLINAYSIQYLLESNQGATHFLSTCIVYSQKSSRILFL